MTNDFKGFGLPAALLETLDRMQYTTPTPIQVQAIPLGLAGKDILGSAQTGTGKTAAFGIPLVNKLLTTPRGSALVLTPTRELAVQVLDVLKKLTGRSGIGSALLIGGESMPAQISQLRSRPRLIVGTPGRINDHLGRGTLMLHEVCFLVMDETDRMLDMGFSSQIEEMMKYLPKQRQTMLFSATLPDNIIKLSAKFLTSPERVAVGSSNTPILKIKQDVVHTSTADKYNHLLKELDARTGSIIVFVKTKHGADKLTERLNRLNHSAEAIHGDLHQRKRERVIQAFRNRKHRIMVATDIAARGLDIPHIEHVINYDLPQCPEDYIHRLGRTARAGAEGASVCFVSPEDNGKWRDIHRLMHPGEAPPPRAPGSGPRGGKGNYAKGGNGGGNGQAKHRRPRRKPSGNGNGASGSYPKFLQA